jgi:HEAT repeat protein
LSHLPRPCGPTEWPADFGVAVAEWAAWASAGLMLGALGWMTWLLMVRLRRDGDARRRAVARAQAQQILVQMVVEPTPELDVQLQAYCRQARLMAELVLEFQLLIRGEERARVFRRLRELGLDGLLATKARSGKLGRTYLEALAALGGPHAQAVLWSAARQAGDPGIRVAALHHLIENGDDVSVRDLLEAAVEGRLEVSRLFSELVRQVTAARPHQTAEAFADKTLPVELRAMLIEALSVSGDYSALDTILAAADEDIEIRTAALRALGRMMHPAAEPVIAKNLQGDTWLARSAAAEAAGRAQLVRLAPLVVRLLDDPEWWVRLRAGEALARLGDAGRAALQVTVSHGTPVARQAAEAALSEHLAA